MLPADPAITVPACIDGRRACPPETAAARGLPRAARTLANPTHPERDERREWTGRPFDPEAFDPSEVDENLRNGRLAPLDDA